MLFLLFYSPAHLSFELGVWSWDKQALLTEMEGELTPKLGVPFSASSEKKFSCLVVPRLRQEKGDFYPLLCRGGMTL